MKWIQYKIHTSTAAVDLIGELLYEQGILGFEVSDHIPPTPEEERRMYTDIPAELEPDDGTAVITFYTEGDNTEEEREFYSTGSSLRDETLPEQSSLLSPEDMIRKLTDSINQLRQCCNIPEPDITYSIQDDSDWKDKWKDNFKAFRVTDQIIVKPVWEDTPDFAKEGDIILQIDPGSAFGTGTHETTKLCMMSLKNYISSETTLLDAGCGSGILAISALMSGAKSAFCLDIDPSAVTGTLENAKLNGISPEQLQAVQGNILEDATQLQNLHPEPFDLVVANILADVIIPLSGCIRPFLKDDGIFISSGILAEKAEAVECALEENHFIILEKNTLGEWISFVARKCQE